jgi:hypothetical protein
MALDKQRQILSIPLLEGTEGFMQLAKLQATTAANVLTTTTKISENGFREREAETLTKLLACIKAGQAADFLDN